MAKIIGIDLGTTNSVAAIVEAGVPRVLENREGSRLTPSVVALSKAGERLVGVLAKRQAVANPQNTVYSIKRLIGRRFEDAEVQGDLKILPYQVRAAANGGVEVKMGDAWHTPEAISAMILQKMKLDVEDKLGEKVTEAVITVPAYFNDSQRQATKNAGEIAGLTVRRILPEPTAAALAYGLDKKKSERILVYDFGGGTFDVSVLEIGDDVIQTVGIDGDTHLGGDDLDNRIIMFLIGEFKKDQGIDLSGDLLATQRLKEAAEKAKQELSAVYETEINLPFITSDASGPKHFYYKLSRNKLEEITRDLIDRSVEIVKRALAAAHMKPEDINEVVLVGGQTRMPLIQQRVKDYFKKEPYKDINPDEVVAVGAAVQAGILQGDVRDVLLLDVTPLTLSLEVEGGIAHPMIPRNTAIPTEKKEVFSTASDNQTQVEIHIVQGERPMARDNKTLARFIMDGIPPAPRGMPQVEVSFDIDANGILSVTAADKATQKKQSVKVEASANLSKDDIERMKTDAEKFADEDVKQRRLAELKNQAEQAVYNARKLVTEYKDKVPDDVRANIEKGIGDVERATAGSDPDAVETALGALNQLLSQIGQSFYGSQGPQQGGSPEGGEDAPQM